MSLSTPSLARFARTSRAVPAAAAPAEESERCELCGSAIAPQHRHLLDIASRELMCVCAACRILFSNAVSGGRHYRLVPERRLRLDDFDLDDVRWEGLRIPVDIAFFHRNTAADRVIAMYPSALGATESLLLLENWNDLVEANPVLRTLEPDVEALLVCRTRGARRHFIVPIDDCYHLVGVIRTQWKGFTGGKEVWREIDAYLDQLAQRSRAQHTEAMVIDNIKTGKPDVALDLPSHVSGINEGNAVGNHEKQVGHTTDGRSSAKRSTGVNSDDQEAIDPRMPNLSPA